MDSFISRIVCQSFHQNGRHCVTSHLNIVGCEPVPKGVDWETANEHCRSQNDAIVDIEDVHDHFSSFNGLKQIWSSIKGHFTPWIAYRGCVQDNNLCSSTNNSCHNIENNTAGNCYFECASKNYTKWGSSINTNFFFGLQNSTCLCLYGDVIIRYILESSKCNFLCRSSFDYGECGGLGFFSVYHSMDISLPDANFGGFCLTIRPQYDCNKTVLYSIDCSDKGSGYCVHKNNSVSSLPSMLSSFASYWSQCKEENLYIIGSLNKTFCLTNSSVWTGLRKYRIDNSFIDYESCYIIEIRQNTINLKQRNCTENIFYLCKNDIGQRNPTNTEYVKITKSTTLPLFTSQTSWTTKMYSSNRSVSFSKTSSIGVTRPIFAAPTSPSLSIISNAEGNTATVIGASVAGVVALIFVVLLTICFFKSRKSQCMQSNQQQANRAKVFHNTMYDDLVVTNEKQDVNFPNAAMEKDDKISARQVDDIYVEKEVEYDHLHTCRQKKMTIQTDDDRYGSASCFEDDSYSTLRQNKNVDPNLDNEYSVNSITYSENQPSSMNSSEYDHCYQTNQN